jgi:hypothetical protein
MEHTNAYNDKVVRQFAIMTVVWGVIGMLVGMLIASQLIWPQLTMDISWLSYGRLRPLHTNAVIFAFGGCGLFATSYYVVQRTCHVGLISDKLAAFTFWGWQAVIVGAVITLPAMLTSASLAGFIASHGRERTVRLLAGILIILLGLATAWSPLRHWIGAGAHHQAMISGNPGSKWINPHHHRKKPLPDHPPVVHLPAIAHRR